MLTRPTDFYQQGFVCLLGIYTFLSLLKSLQHGQIWLARRSDVCEIRGIATRIRNFLAAQPQCRR